MTTESYSDYDFKYHMGIIDGCQYEALRSKTGYEEFISTHPELDDLTYMQWVDLLDFLESNGKEPALGFQPPPNLGALGTGVMSALAGRALNLGPNANIDDIVDAGSNFLRQQIGEKMRNMGGSGGDGINVDSNGGDGGTSQENYSGGSSFNPTGLSLNLKPVDTSFNTGIVPLYRPKFFLDGTNGNAPLMIKVRNVFPEYTEPTSLDLWGGNADIQRYLENKVTSSWINTISTKVRLNSFTSPLVNFKHIMNYYRILTYSLSVLYFFRSIDAHFRMDGNRNDAMISLYKSLNAEDIRQISILAQILDEIPLDPMVNEFTFHFFDNYKQSHLPGSPLVKFSPIPFNGTNDNNFSSFISGQSISCIEMLKSKPFRDFQALLVQAYPDSVKNKTMSYSGVPKFDANWLTCWTNQVFLDTGSGIRPSVADDSTPVLHNLFTDAPDGWIDAANNLYNSTTGHLEGGFGGPKFLAFDVNHPEDKFPITFEAASSYSTAQATHSTDSFIYATDTNNSGQEIQSFFPLEYRERYQILSGNTFKTVLGVSGVKSFQRSGAELAIPRTIRDNVPICNQFADKLYSPSNFGSTSRSSSSSMDDIVLNDSKPASKPRRRRRKMKKSK